MKRAATPSKKFRSEYTDFIKRKWTSINPAIIDLIIQDTIMFFEAYHRDHGCFYK